MTPEQHLITSACGLFTRDVWLVPGLAEQAQRLCIILDGEHYLRDMDCLPILSELTSSGVVPATTWVFVGHGDGSTRVADFCDNEEYARFIATDVVGWARKMNPRLSKGDHTIGGLSLSGLAAGLIALRSPQVFSRAFAQSGSFWWLADNPRPLTPSSVSSSARVWLSVGNEETATNVAHPPTTLFQRISQIEGVKMLAEQLTSLGATVNYHEYKGGHKLDPWKLELGPALAWLIGESSTAT